MKTFAIATLGCKVNTYESEGYRQSLIEAGFQEVDFQEYSDIYIINTCAVTNTAASKSRQKIRQAKIRNENAKIVVIGCYAQIDAEKIQKELQVDLLIGSKDKSKLVEMLQEIQKDLKPKNMIHPPRRNSVFEAIPVWRFENQTRAFLKIQDGCNQFCSYCIIPMARGVERSISMEDALKSAHQLVKNGHQEIVLTGIHTGRFGLERQESLHLLLEKMCKINKLKRIRISSIEINEVTDELVQLMKDNKKIARHLHIPIQSGCNFILEKMRRPYQIEYFYKRVHEIRMHIPDISISTDVIVGFPGETEEHFIETKKALNDLEFSFLHVFPFSPKNGTLAANMENHISNLEKKRRVQELLELSNRLQEKYCLSKVNKIATVLIESKKDNYLYGHTSEYLEIYVEGILENIHQLKQVMITRYDKNHLYGIMLEESV